ncbi:MAG: TrlF family AAA-like ATPase [Rectinemataceae bacterium]
MSGWDFAGARWWKFDFHAHTPASVNDYGHGDIALKNRTPREWLLDYMAKRIDCVAVTDHNTGAWIDRLKDEYAAMLNARPVGFRELTIYPGMELTVHGNIHFLVILDTTKGRSHIDSLRGACLYDETSGATTKSPLEVVKTIDEIGGIAIPAHVDDKGAGLFAKLKDGHSLPPLLMSSHIFAMEVRDPVYVPLELYKTHKTAWTTIVGSDAHMPSQVGQAFTWVKMGQPTIEGLRLALLDGALSVRRHDEVQGDPNRVADFVIRSLEIQNARYCGNGEALRLSFSPWLNCIIGGRGTGKSTAVEMLRIALKRESYLKERMGSDSEVTKAFIAFARVPENRQAKGALRLETAISVECQLGAERFRLGWSYDGQRSSILRIDETGNEVASPGEIPTRFPVSIYSQKQIYEMAGNPAALLDIVDAASEIGFAEWKAHRDSLQTRFRTLRAQARELSQQIGEEMRLRGELEDVDAKLHLLGSGENAAILKGYQTRQAQRRELDAFGRSLGASADLLEGIRLESDTINSSLFDEDAESREAIALAKVASHRLEALNARLSEIKIEAMRIPADFSREIAASSWKSVLDTATGTYAELVITLSAAGVGNPDEYGMLVQKKQQLETRLIAIESLNTQIASLNQEAQDRLRDFDVHRKELSEKRAAFLKNTLEDTSIVRMQLQERGQAIEGLELEFRRLIGREGETFRKDLRTEDGTKGFFADSDTKTNAQILAQLKAAILEMRNGSVPEGNSKPFAEFIARLQAEVIDSIDLWIPEDNIAVEYLRDPERNEYAPIEQGSPGQKTAAILAFILAQGTEPLILDQPEDDLDNHLIYSLVVEQIRENKKRRQLIIITHNPNIVVNGDAEYVYALAAQSGQTIVEEKGCLQELDVRKSICSIMEGGTEAFRKRYARISMGDIDVR